MDNNSSIDVEKVTCDMAPMEYQTFLLIVQGKTNREIALARVVSVRTIETQVSAILQKTGCNSRCELISLFLSGNKNLNVEIRQTKRSIVVKLFSDSEEKIEVADLARKTGLCYGYVFTIIKSLKKCKRPSSS